MTINLPDDLEHFIRAEVHQGHFASEDDAIAEAVRLLRLQLARAASPTPTRIEASPDPLLGVMQDAAAELDDIVAEAMGNREHQPWRLTTR